MKTFKLDQDGDVVILNGQIELVEGVELIAQTVRQELATNIGEWLGDNGEDEGIDFSVILTKNPNYDLIQDTINTAVQRVADGLGVELETDNFAFELVGRSLTINFSLMADGESTHISMTL